MDQDRPGFTPPPAGSTPGDLPETVTSDVVSSSPRGRRFGAGVLVAAVGITALGIAGATYAAASDPSPSPSVTGEGPAQVPGLGGDRDGDHGGPGGYGQAGPGGKGGPGDGRGHGPRSGFPGAVHGTFVVKDKDGTGFTTVQMQHGTVTAVSATSISVKSEDGFTATYVVDADTKVNRDGAIADIKADADVMVMATVDGSTATAQRIVDTAAFGKGGFGRGDHDGDGPGATKSPEAAPSGSA
ncbi:MAG: hypothetical protein AB7V23_04695 [Candidatus Nanopelagicales bacterium]